MADNEELRNEVSYNLIFLKMAIIYKNKQEGNSRNVMNRSKFGPKIANELCNEVQLRGILLPLNI